MASIIDSFKEVSSEKFSIFKMLIFTVAVYYAYTIFVANKGFSANFWTVAFWTAFFLFGLLVKVTNNLINETHNVLPPLNPLKLAFSSLKGIVAIALPTYVACSIVNYISAQIFILPWVDVTLKTILWLVAAAIIVTSFLMFCRNESIKEAFNLKLLFEKAGDLILVLIFFILQLILMNMPTTALIGYAIFILLGYGPVFDFFMAFALVFNIVIAGHYMGQVHYEALGAKE